MRLSRQVSATFAASLVTSPAIGVYLSSHYDDSLVVLVATVIAVADIAFVFFVVPESLPDKMRLTSWGLPISWEQADPFAVSWQICILPNQVHTGSSSWIIKDSGLVCFITTAAESPAGGAAIHKVSSTVLDSDRGQILRAGGADSVG